MKQNICISIICLIVISFFACSEENETGSIYVTDRVKKVKGESADKEFAERVGKRSVGIARKVPESSDRVKEKSEEMQIKLFTSIEEDITKESADERFVDVEGRSVDVAKKARDEKELIMPQFPWPPPKASSRSEVPKNFFCKVNTKYYTLEDIDSRIRYALEPIGYTEKSYYAVPYGFALVTRLEQIEPDGTPKAGIDRWVLEVSSPHNFSFISYLQALFTANVGYFRVIVFMVTPYCFSYSDAKIDQEETLNWLQDGFNRLPPSVGEQPYTTSYCCTALVYEFEKNDIEEEARARIPGRLTGRIHLERSGIWASLGG